MQASLDCVPCLARQALEAIRFLTADPEAQEGFLRQVLGVISEADLSQSPPALAQMIHRRLREITGADDPYRERKDRFNRMAVEMLPELKARVAAAPDPLALSARLAIAGNVIDLGVNGGLTTSEARLQIEQALSEPLVGDMNAFRQAVAGGGRILFLADNAGEIVFDRLLIERLPRGRVTVAVRGSPILNDATRSDALEVGLHEVCEVIDNGSDAPGTVLRDCSPEFLGHFRRSDLIIAKGQGNFETLCDQRANVFFLFKVKCQVIASHAGLPTGTQVLARIHSDTASGEGKDHATI